MLLDGLPWLVQQAMARGSYEAFGQRFLCESLEYLHQDDKAGLRF